ncbi:MAG TPA: hypothetical protein PKK23_04610 [Nitrospirales bacterium]|nr:hypothetical protein [Nitrospirales bacterium]
MDTTPRSKVDDARLKKALEHADIGKFQQVLQKSFEKVLIPNKKPEKKK